MAAPGVAEEQEHEGPVSLEGLAALWEKDEVVRTKLLHTGSLLSWPSTKAKGVVTFDSMRLNSAVIEKALDLWLPLNKFPKTVSIDAVRDEDCVANSI